MTQNRSQVIPPAKYVPITLRNTGVKQLGYDCTFIEFQYVLPLLQYSIPRYHAYHMGTKNASAEKSMLNILHCNKTPIGGCCIYSHLQIMLLWYYVKIQQNSLGRVDEVLMTTGSQMESGLIDSIRHRAAVTLF